MDVLQAALRPIASVLNRNIAATTPARELCVKLSGSVIAIRIRDTALSSYFVVHDDLLELLLSTDREPDVLITGSALTLARLAGPASEALFQDGSLELSGDAETAQQFRQLLEYARPDVEEELSHVVGDVAAHQLGKFVRNIGRWGLDARTAMGANIREYLQEESRDVPGRYEVEKFIRNIGTIRDDVDRLEARVSRLRGEGT